MARASTPTILSLDRYAKIMGIPPMHFNGGYVDPSTADVFPLEGCESIWFQYDWQNHDQVSREQLAMVIHSAEEEIARVVGYYPAPVWIASEEHDYPRPYPPDTFGANGMDVRGMYKSVNANFGRVVMTGRRKVTLLGSPNITYWDLDSDGFFELGAVNITTTVPKCQIKTYFANQGGDPIWEIKPKNIASVGNVHTFSFDSWQLISQSLFEEYPSSAGMTGVNISTIANFVVSIDFYQETFDPVEPASEFYWEPYSTPCPSCSGTGCDACALVEQDGCLSVRDNARGILTPIPAAYDAATGQWAASAWDDCREPDQVKLWYYAGDQDQRYLQGYTCDPLSNFWAETIAYLATARLERPVCSCGNIAALFEDLRTDLVRSESGGASYFSTNDVLNSPFGTRKGEVMAWRRVSKMVRRRIGVATL